MAKPKKTKTPPCPKLAVLDGDILAYQAAWTAEVEGVEGYLDARIENDIKKLWTPEKGMDIVVALSCPRDENYRRKFWPLYKAHRDDKAKKPDALPFALEFLRNTYEIIERDTLEADDIMGMLASSGKAVAVTIDKDLRSVPGWHFNPDKDISMAYVTEFEADWNFHYQWLKGDTTDNVPGLWKCGDKKARAILEGKKDSKSMTKAVMAAYKEGLTKEGKPYTKEECLAQARCVRILRDGDYNGKKVKLWVP